MSAEPLTEERENPARRRETSYVRRDLLPEDDLRSEDTCELVTRQKRAIDINPSAKRARN